MIEIVKFERPTIGYRQNNAVVYASVPDDLPDEAAKQYGYEQVKAALEYEQTKDKPSIDGSDMENIEEFIPETPKVKSIKLIGDSYVRFEQNESERMLNFSVKAIDQYGDPIVADWVWTGASDGKLMVMPTDESINVTVSADGVSDSKAINVYPYVAPVPAVDEMAILKAKIEANTEMLNFQEEVITEIILTIMP